MTEQRNFLYALVAYGNTPLAEVSIIQGTNNVKPIVLRMLESIDPKREVHIFEQDQYVFQCFTTQDNMRYLCLTEKTVISELRTEFLDQLRKKWLLKYGNQGHQFKSLEKATEFGPEIDALINTFNSNQISKIAVIKDNIAKAQETMTENLSEALLRGEKLTIMEEKADRIKTNAAQFKYESARVRRKMCFQRYRWYILGVIVVIVIIIVLLFIACGVTFEKCK